MRKLRRGDSDLIDDRKVNKSTADEFLSGLSGKILTCATQGYGSALLLQFGRLKVESLNGRRAFPVGEFSLRIEWSWRIERQRSILLGSWSKEDRISEKLKEIVGMRVEKVETFGFLPEVNIFLSHDFRIASFMTFEGQPSWALIDRTSPNASSLRIKRGNFYISDG